MKQNNHEGTHENEPPRRLQPRIWVASLADYNAGRLHGDWLDAAVDSADLLSAVARILATSREPDAEEWGIFDYDGFGGYQVGEYESLDDLAAIARGIEHHGAAFATWAEIHDGDPDMLTQFDECFLGTYDSAADWAREVLDNSDVERILDDQIPTDLRGYVQVDYDSFAEDQRLSGSVQFEHAPDGQFWVFRVI